jgi:redox-sensing transcriptional repressor
LGDVSGNGSRGAEKEEEKTVNNKEISQAVVARLPRYYRYLGDLRDEGVERISSQELSKIMHVTASQIRQDFNHFGGFGQQGYGYNTDYLYEEIGKILGLDHPHNMILIGAGHLGSALIGYMNFRRRGYLFKAAFDINETLFNQTISGIPVYPMSDMPDYIKNNNIDIVVITIPKQEAVKVVEVLNRCPIKAIWNFAHCELEVREDIQVENVHLSDSLMQLSYQIRQYELRHSREEEDGKKDSTRHPAGKHPHKNEEAG